MVRILLCVVGLVVTCLAQAPTTQGRFLDDAGRSVVLPRRVSRVFAAGAPAEVMVYTLAPDLLVGRNWVPSGDALEFFPPKYRNPTQIRQLPEVDNPAADAELIALKPDVYVDYGTVGPDYVDSVDTVQRRTKVPGIILDGALARIPEMYRRLGVTLGVKERGDLLANVDDRFLGKYKGALASPTPVRVYIACSGDGYVPCLEDDSGGEQLRWLGGTNVAGTRATAPRRPLTIAEIQALNAEVIIINGPVASLRADKAWQNVDAVKAGRVYQWPSLPYGWGGRPPSVNRLPGVAWLAYVARGRSFDAEFNGDLRELFQQMYHIELTEPQLEKLLSMTSAR
jgi:iron complex transport system substrate-binding protein